MFDVLLSLDRRYGSVIAFEMDQLLDSVLPGEPGNRALAVLIDAADKIIRHADIQRSARLVGQNIDKIVCHGGAASWIAGSSPAMTDRKVVLQLKMVVS